MSKPEKNQRLKLADFPEFVAIVEKHKALQAVADRIKLKLEQMILQISDFDRQQRDFDARQRAQRLIDGVDIGELAVRPLDQGQAELKVLRQQLTVAEEAVRLHREQSHSTLCNLRHQVREAAEAAHKALALRIGTALDELYEAMVAEERFRDEVAKDADPAPVWPFSSCPLPHGGMPGRKAAWVERSLIDMWRREQKDYLGVPQLAPESLGRGFDIGFQSITSWRPAVVMDLNPP